MKGKRIVVIILFIALAVLAVSCKKKEKKTADLHQFVSELKAKSNEQDNSAPVNANIKKPINYKAGNARHPFAGQIYIGDEQLSTHSRYSEKALQNYRLADLKLVGVLFSTPTKWVLIETPDKAVYSVTIGTLIGNEGGKLSDVSFDSAKIQNQQQVIILKLSKFRR